MLPEAEVKHVLFSNGEPGRSAAQELWESGGEERASEVVGEQDNGDAGSHEAWLSSVISEPKVEPENDGMCSRQRPRTSYQLVLCLESTRKWTTWGYSRLTSLSRSSASTE
jgi:hypothetical protein